MKNITIKILAVLMMLGAFAVISFAQTPKRIDFAKEGSPSLVWEETVAAGKSKSFVFYAKKGQQLSLGFIDDTNKASMDLGKISVEPNGDPLEMEIEVTKDYLFSVSNNSNKSTSFRIFITLENAKSSSKTSGGSGGTSNTSALDFTGSDQANVSKTIPANGTMKFTFDGTKGVTAIVNVADRTNKLTVIFNENANQKADTTIALNKDVSRKLSRTGEYTIEVVNETAKSISFDLEVSIDVSGSAPASSTDNGIRVQFAKGETSTSVTKDIPANGSVDFLINVRKGQTMGYTVGYDFKDSDIEAYLGEPGDQDASIPVAPKAPQTFVVKKSGDHFLEVTNTTKKKVTITLYLDVE
ncbi:MAG: hypothetical protein AAB336_12460 [Acidobacteriota bacterium]